MNAGDWIAITAGAITVISGFLKVFSDYSKMQTKQKHIDSKCDSNTDRMDKLEEKHSDQVRRLHERINDRVGRDEIMQIQKDVSETKGMIVQLYNSLMNKGG